MKTIRIITLMCIMLFSCNISSNAQSAAKVGKVVKEFVKKGTKGKKPTGVKPKSSTTAKPRVLFVDCSTCNGKGKVNVWNSYYGMWQTQNCSRCNGTGKVRRN